MTEPILVSTSIDHSQITSSQINAIRSNIRRLEKQFQFKNLFKIEQINLEKDINFISLINSSFQSLLRLGNVLYFFIFFLLLILLIYLYILNLINLLK